MKKYKCPSCKKMIPVDSSEIKAGDEVSFCKVMQTSKSARFSSREGIVECREGDVVLVKYRKEIIPLNIKDVSPVDAPSPLTYAFVGTCECKEA
ncbi:hypothetical protein [Acinetobacter baumannii]|uniref:hypothetical protein n=1 Tax=Acinetobacter baumannii TaxID=470 RepID=UPI001F1EC7D5|nr:hypothetical protein [Acinetobacter baumannii]MCF1300033.1 hypothetical protein [Acinetobacter baumannii]HAV4522300.1 hypothetical protein [Acinetobacter baumannii]HAV4562579.1 hypothetical protein [Acinetobacter baumannii]